MRKREDVKCQICGGIADIIGKEMFDNLVENYGSACVSVRCWKCKIEMYENSDSKDYKYKRTGLLKRWNQLRMVEQ